MHSGRLCEGQKISEGLHRTGGNIPTVVSITSMSTFVPLHEDAQKVESSKKNSRPATSWIKLNQSTTSITNDTTYIDNDVNQSTTSITKDTTYIDNDVNQSTTSITKDTTYIDNDVNQSTTSINKDTISIGNEASLKSWNSDVQISRILSDGQSASENTYFESPKLECSQDKFSPKKYSLEIE